MSEIGVIIKKPGEPAYEAWIANELETLQQWVGGYIETYALSYSPAVIAICNEEGKLEGMPYNCRLAGEHFVGTIVLVGIDEEGDEFDTVPIGLKTAMAFWPELRGPRTGRKTKA